MAGDPANVASAGAAYRAEFWRLLALLLARLASFDPGREPLREPSFDPDREPSFDPGREPSFERRHRSNFASLPTALTSIGMSSAVNDGAMSARERGVTGLATRDVGPEPSAARGGADTASSSSVASSVAGFHSSGVTE